MGDWLRKLGLRGGRFRSFKTRYVRTAKAKGLSTFQILTKHVGRNASITIVTAVASSLGWF